MFQDEDWNIDEDDLKDFNSDDIFNHSNDKAENLLSKKSAEIKNKKVVSLNTSGLKCNVSEKLQNNVILQPNELVSQKKVVLNIFKSSSNSQKVLKIDHENSSILETEELLECISNKTNESKKNLILNVFQENVEKPKPVIKSVLKIFDQENKLKRKKNVAFSYSPGDSNVAKKVCTDKGNKLQEAAKNNLYIHQENQILAFETGVPFRSDADSCKKQILIDLLKSSTVHKSTKVPCVKQAVIRKFPGPAGILPDDANENDVIDLDSLDENKNKSNQYADICSQNTKNLFTTGAWQLMMDDLPAGFELCDIATIKENALQFSKTYKKVPYLAGVVQYIDYKPNDPHIILKDLSGKVDTRVHHSICKLYPNALGTSVVILAKDVGLIVTSKKFVCVIISLNNLVSIYSDDARLVETPHLKALLNNDSTSHTLHESQISVLDETECHDNNEACKTHSQEIKNSHQEQCVSILSDELNIEKLKEINSKDMAGLKIIRKETDMHEFEFDEDDSWLGVNIDELNSFKPHQFPSSTPMDTREQSSNDVCFQIKKSKNVVSKGLNNALESEKIVLDLKQPCSAYDKQKTITRQTVISKQIDLTKNISSTMSKPFERESNDTDDEMLSQLDVDAIAASYSTQNC